MSTKRDKQTRQTSNESGERELARINFETRKQNLKHPEHATLHMQTMVKMMLFMMDSSTRFEESERLVCLKSRTPVASLPFQKASKQAGKQQRVRRFRTSIVLTKVLGVCESE